jgi:hypothetical protein
MPDVHQSSVRIALAYHAYCQRGLSYKMFRSDALFVMARTVSSLLGQEEATYQPCRRDST